ncbi:MAG: glycosyltransferase family 4 protein [Candidatus Pacebacteria bacterium]|nr:glycosyltransferase family 4 protein [Candidatus Paceibacterota bacterium]
MKIGIDFTSAIYHRGVSRYTKNLVRSLLENTNANLALYGSSFRQKQELIDQAQELITQTLATDKVELAFQSYPPSVLQLLWKLGLNPVNKTIKNLDVFHSWDWLQPPDKNIPLVSTIHDLAILKYPEVAHPKVLRAHQESWKILKERQAEIIAVSQATKKDIVRLLDIPAYKIHVIPEALPREIRMINELLSEELAEKIKQQYSLNRPYLLFVGTREPRKNLQRLIEAWQPLKNNLDLIIVGESGWDGSEQIQDPQLRFLGKVSDQVLNVLYAEAEAFVYPSLDEGFGLPILEAFYHGTPVVTSNVSALIEVAGNAAELVNPEDVTDITKGIETILQEDTMAQQQRLQRMIIRMHMFSWHLVAEQTMEVYKKAITNYE